MEAKNNVTELVFILDRSGSMSGLEEDTIGGFNAMLQKQKKENGEAYVSTILFDNVSEVLHDRIKLKDVPKMTDEEYTVRGCTALMDAIGGAIRHIGNIHKYARPEDVPAHTMFIITTDGMENASVHYSSDEVKNMIERQKENKNYVSSRLRKISPIFKFFYKLLGMKRYFILMRFLRRFSRFENQIFLLNKDYISWL